MENLSTVLLVMWKQGQNVLDAFWKIWKDEYLKSLRETQKVQMKPVKGEIDRIPKIGEMVIVEDEALPRGSWKMARIESLIQSDVDDLHRAANLITVSGKRLKRPFRVIYPLEGTNLVESDTENESTKPDKINVVDNSKANNYTLMKNARTIRRAAAIAREKMRRPVSNSCQTKQFTKQLRGS